MEEKEATVASAPRKSRWLLHLLVCVALAGATTLIYSGDLNLGFFNLDDDNYVINNPLIKQVSRENLVSTLTKPYFANYSPLHILSYTLDYTVAGLNPRTFHLSSNIWAGIAAAMVYLTGLVLIRQWLPALAASMLFVIHPAHVEAVVWISSRKDLVAAALGLPAVFCYLLYRRSEKARALWYVLSLLGFALGLAGKLSVVVIPVLLLLFDVFMEKRRRWWLTLLDKAPFVGAAVFFGLMTMSAQPDTRGQTTLFTVGATLLHNLWLLTGFGSYTLYRDQPDPNAGPLAYMLMGAVLVAAFLAPLAFRRRVPGFVLCLAYWVLLALIPPQMLSFLHPVTDRYLFFPSVAACLLIGWGLMEAGKAWNRKVIAVAAAALLAGAWSAKTLGYVAEWNDPRSVWYGASHKSGDANVHFYYGAHLQDMADYLLNGYPTNEAQRAELRALADAMWTNDQRHAALIGEWSKGTSSRPATTGFRNAILDEARTAFEKAAQRKGTILMPNLYFRRGKLAVERRDSKTARTEFTQARDEARRHSSAEVRGELAVRCAFALGVVEWGQRDYVAAMRWLDQAEAEQQRAGKVWIPDIALQKSKLKGLMTRPPNATQPAPGTRSPAETSVVDKTAPQGPSDKAPASPSSP